MLYRAQYSTTRGDMWVDGPYDTSRKRLRKWLEGYGKAGHLTRIVKVCNHLAVGTQINCPTNGKIWVEVVRAIPLTEGAIFGVENLVGADRENAIRLQEAAVVDAMYSGRGNYMGIEFTVKVWEPVDVMAELKKIDFGDAQVP